MAKGCRGRRMVASRQLRHAPYMLPNCSEGACAKKCSKTLANDWEDAICSVCMECPHNAVLLLCSSHDKGCRPYMCGTSLRFSNCLDQYKKAYTKVGAMNNEPFEKSEMTELACPLCRGKVKGWAVVKPARKHLNSKKRSCMQDGCLFSGSYKELRRHVKSEHASACPRDVDPAVEQKWRLLEREREHGDVISTIRSSMPGAVVYGDYVIEQNEYDSDSEDEEDAPPDGETNRNGELDVGFGGSNMVNVLLFLHAISPNSSPSNNRRLIRGGRDSQMVEDGPFNDQSFSDQQADIVDHEILGFPSGTIATTTGDSTMEHIGRLNRRC